MRFPCHFGKKDDHGCVSQNNIKTYLYIREWWFWCFFRIYCSICASNYFQ